MALNYAKNLVHKPNELSLLVLRIIIGLMWLSEGLIKLIDRNSLPNDDFHGLLIQIKVMADTNPFSFVSSLINTYLVPNYVLLAWIVILLEIGLAISVIFGVFSRIGSVVGIIYALILYVGTLGWPDEWIWSYFMIVMAMLVIFISSFETRIGLDSYLYNKFKDNKLISLLL